MNWTNIFSVKFWKRYESNEKISEEYRHKINVIQAELGTLKDDIKWILDEISRINTKIQSEEIKISKLYDTYNELQVIITNRKGFKSWEDRFPKKMEVDEDKYMSKNDCLKLLFISESYLNLLKRSGHFNGCKVGRNIYYSRESVSNFLTEFEQQTNGAYTKKER